MIELWDTVNGGTAIYPSDGFLALQINDNVTGLSGGLVSSITVDDFIQQFSDLSQQLKQEVSDAVSDGSQGIQDVQGKTGPAGKDGINGADGKDAVINIISQTDYDKLGDKSGVYFIEG